MESTIFFVFLMIHLFGLLLGLGSVIVTDLFGMLWILNHIRFPQVIQISARTEKFIWAGWVILVAAGIPLILIKGFVDNLMIVKIFFVILIAINGTFLHFIHKRIKHYTHEKHVPKIFMFRLILAICVSQLSWWSAFIIGFLHRHVKAVINWPDHPYLFCLGIFTGLTLIWKVGELFIKRRNLQ